MECKGMPMAQKTVAELIEEKQQRLLEIEKNLRAAFDRMKQSDADLAMKIGSLGVMGLLSGKSPKP
jgi:hypothetical protein